MKTWIGICALVLAWPVARAEVRAWKTADGAKTLLAEYVRSGDGKVTIRRKSDRKDFTISLNTLSEADQEWVKKKEAEVAAEKEEGEATVKEVDREFAKLLTGSWEKAEGHNLISR